MLLECIKTNDFWALTIGGLYHVKEDEDGVLYVIDDNGIEVGIGYEGWYTWSLAADPTVTFEEE